MKEITEITQTIILAGGAGERLRPLTEHRAKPAVFFGGKYRIIDFVLSNCLHSKLRKIYVFPQYEPKSLHDHLDSWSRIFSTEMGEYLSVISPRSQADKDLIPYSGTADAVLQNLRYLVREKADYILILAGDQIYRMDYRELIDFHCKNKADMTMAVAETNKEVAQRSGVVEINKNQRVADFNEKPQNPKSLPDNPDKFFISMSVYVFSREFLFQELEEDSQNHRSNHDFGKNIIPKVLRKDKIVFAFPLLNHETGRPGYWRDVGTLESYYDANMDLCSIKPEFNLYDGEWFLRTTARQLPPAKTVFRSEIKESIICEGCIIDDAGIYRSIISPEVRVGRDVLISNSIIMQGVEIADGVKINRAIIDKENKISPGSVIEAGSMKYEGKYEVTPSGIVVISRHEESLNND